MHFLCKHEKDLVCRAERLVRCCAEASSDVKTVHTGHRNSLVARARQASRCLIQGDYANAVSHASLILCLIVRYSAQCPLVPPGSCTVPYCFERIRFMLLFTIARTMSNPLTIHSEQCQLNARRAKRSHSLQPSQDLLIPSPGVQRIEDPMLQGRQAFNGRHGRQKSYNLHSPWGNRRTCSGRLSVEGH